MAGAEVPIDTLDCQKGIADPIRERYGDYVLATKQNQPTPCKRLGKAIEAGLEQDPDEEDVHQTDEACDGPRESQSCMI